MPLMDDDTKGRVKETFASMEGPVHILVFTDREHCAPCDETVAIMKELSGLADMVTFEAFDITENKELAAKYGIEMTPATLIMKGAREGYEYLGIRFFGIPAGYEFTSLIDAVMTVSNGETLLSESTREYLGKLDKDIHMQVFVTLTCPYCPRAVVLAHHMAMHSDRLVSDMVEAGEFPELAAKYNVMGVPRTVINGKLHQEGAAPERMILDLIKRI